MPDARPLRGDAVVRQHFNEALAEAADQPDHFRRSVNHAYELLAARVEALLPDQMARMMSMLATVAEGKPLPNWNRGPSYTHVLRAQALLAKLLEKTLELSGTGGSGGRGTVRVNVTTQVASVQPPRIPEVREAEKYLERLESRALSPPAGSEPVVADAPVAEPKAAEPAAPSFGTWDEVLGDDFLKGPA